LSGLISYILLILCLGIVIFSGYMLLSGHPKSIRGLIEGDLLFYAYTYTKE